MDNPTIEAVKEFLLRRFRVTYPKGYMIHRWDPHDEERRDCCNHVREPSRAYPWSLYNHCKTLKHICNLFPGAVESQARIMIRTPVLLIGLHPAIDKWIEPKLKKG